MSITLAGVSTGTVIGIAIAVIVLLVLIVPNIKIVPQAATFIIERLGTYRTTWETGFHISTSILLTLTTTPLKMSDALEGIFKPLQIIKIPVHEMAMMMSIALRFIPTLASETDKIMKAQQSRGADYDTGSFINKVKGYITVLIPLFVSSFRRADELAVAMDARCYHGGKGRTKLNPLKLTLRDVLAGIMFTLLAVLVVIIDLSLR